MSIPFFKGAMPEDGWWVTDFTKQGIVGRIADLERRIGNLVARIDVLLARIDRMRERIHAQEDELLSLAAKRDNLYHACKAGLEAMLDTHPYVREELRSGIMRERLKEYGKFLDPLGVCAAILLMWDAVQESKPDYAERERLPGFEDIIGLFKEGE